MNRTWIRRRSVGRENPVRAGEEARIVPAWRKEASVRTWDEEGPLWARGQEKEKQNRVWGKSKRLRFCRGLAAALCILICTTSAGPALAYGAEASAGESMEFSGPEIRLSLSGAVRRMQTEGVAAKNAEINKQSDQAVAGGYAETVTTLRDADGNSTSLDTDIYGSEINKDIATIKRDFAKSNIDNNFQASMNAIEESTVETYYNLLLAQDNVKAAEENLDIQKELLRVTQEKTAAGKASDNELLSARTAVKSAEDQLLSSEASLTNARMAANIQFGYDVMQNVTLTDKLEESTEEIAPLSEAISSARANRLEVKSAELSYEIQSTLLSHLKYRTATNSSTYLSQLVTVNQAEQKVKNTPLELEQELRGDYLAVQTAESSLETARAKLEQAQRDFELAELSYEIGAKTLNDVQSAQLSVFQAEQSVSSAVKEYNLAVYAYRMAQSVGTQRISL